MSAVERTLGRVRVRLSTRGMVLTVIVVVLLVTAIFPLRTFFSQRSQVGQLEARIGELEVQNRQLQHEIHQLHDPVFLEKMARECLGMVKPGELSFVVVPRGGAPKPRPC